MTLRELLLSVNAEEYADVPLYQELIKVKPEYGSNKHIGIKILNGHLAVSNVHVGAWGEIITYSIDINPELHVTKIQLLDAILKEMSSEGYGNSE